MIPKDQTQRPPFNDALYRALSPLQKALQDKQRLQKVMEKYGRHEPALPDTIAQEKR